MTVLYTVGHSTHEIGAFVALLRGAGIRTLVDVRVAPGSRRNPQFQREALAGALEEAGISYAWEGERLGGFRKPRPDSRHTALRNEGFRGYADHTETQEFREALNRVLTLADEGPTAVMCAEAVWWRCHRGLIADAVVAAGGEARHIMPDGSIREHRLREVVRVEDGLPVYDRTGNPAQPTLDQAEG